MELDSHGQLHVFLLKFSVIMFVLCIYYVCVDSCTYGCSQHMGFGLHAIKGTQQTHVTYVLLVQHSFSGQ